MGKGVIVDGTGRYKDIIGLKCTFVSRYFDNINFQKHVCDIDEEIYKKITDN